MRKLTLSAATFALAVGVASADVDAEGVRYYAFCDKGHDAAGWSGQFRDADKGAFEDCEAHFMQQHSNDARSGGCEVRIDFSQVEEGGDEPGGESETELE